MEKGAQHLIFQRETPGSGGERRYASVMFADLVGSTDLIASLDIDDAKDLLDSFITKAQHFIHQFGGTVARVQGDGIMALFGAPVAQEDHAQRAASAALELSAYCDAVAQQDKAGYSVRIGIHSGEVGLRWQENDFGRSLDVVGSAAHIAAKLQQSASINGVVLSKATQLALGPRFATEQAADLPSSGEAGPIGTYRLIGRTTGGATKNNARTGTDDALVGRGEYLGIMARALRNETRDCVFGFIGSPGIGKSRLLEELERQVLGAGLPLLQIVGQSLDRASPLGVLDSSVLKTLDATNGLVASRPIPESKSGDNPGDWSDLSPDARGEIAIEDWVSRILEAGQSSRLAIIVDDFHYLDGETKRVLSRLAKKAHATNHIMLIGGRPESEDEIREMAESCYVLPPLSDADALHFVRMRWHATGAERDELPNTIGQTIQQRAQGMPLALQQFSDHCFNLVRAGDDPLLSLPHELDTIFRTQIDRLSETPRTIFQIGCVLGYEFERSALEELAGVGTEIVDEAIHELLAKELLFPLGDDRFRFAHQLFQEAGYFGILKRQREKLHQRAYELLKASDGSRSNNQLLGWHADRARFYRDALDHYVAAMKSAIGNGNILTVDEIYSQARHVCDKLGEEGRGRKALFLLHAFDAMQQLGKQEWYREDVEDAARFFEEKGDPIRTALATGHLAITQWTGARNLQSLETARKAKRLAYATGHEPLMIYADFTLGNVEFLCGEPRKGIERLKALVARLGGGKETARFGDMISVPGIMARTFSVWYLYDMGEVDLAQDYCDQSRDLVAIVNQNYSHVQLGLAEAYLLYRHDRFAEASALLEKVVRRCHEQSIFGLETIACARLAGSLISEGRLDEAETLLKRHQTDGHLAPVQHSCAYYRWESEARLLAARGLPEEALAVLKTANAESVRQNDPLHLLHGRFKACEIKLDAGIETDRAIAELRETCEKARNYGFVPLAKQCEDLVRRGPRLAAE